MRVQDILPPPRKITDKYFSVFKCSRMVKETQIVVRKQNAIFIPNTIYELYAKLDTKYAVLFADKENKEIGIKFFNEKDAPAYAYSVAEEGCGYSLGLDSLFKHLGVPEHPRTVIDVNVENEDLIFSYATLFGQQEAIREMQPFKRPYNKSKKYAKKS